MIIKCKMCGGDILFHPGDTSGQCEYCGSTSTIPKVDDEQRLNRYNRANHFRRQGEFDKAITAYERILEEDDTDAEAHWGAALSRYGIEYVEDPVSRRRIPTCHRVQLESILADPDYQAAVKYAPDTLSRNLYEEQAKEIAEIQKGILAISANEKPYDVFICYKESDENGQRTRDSALAQEVYYGLTEQGYKVFFSRITLEDKLGQEYEPYIFAALNSARVMVVIGTKPEYFSAVWVKNEWSRYLHLMKNDRKRLLIPCYRDMDPYDLPEELSALQSQDMSRIGFMQDLLRGIRKVLEENRSGAASQAQSEIQPKTSMGSVSPLLRRAMMFLEDKDWNSADEYAEKVLDLEPENGQAYLVKLMVNRKVAKPEKLAQQDRPFLDDPQCQKVLRYGELKLVEQIKGWNQAILDRNEHNRKNGILEGALAGINKATTVQQYENIKKELEQIRGFEGVDEAMDLCDKRIAAITEERYNNALSRMQYRSWTGAIEGFRALQGYRDSEQKILECEEGIRADKYQNALEEQERREWDQAIADYRALGNYLDCVSRAQQCENARDEEKHAREEKQKQERLIAERKAREAARKKRKNTILAISILAVIVAVYFVTTKVIIPRSHYDRGVALRASGEWEPAVTEFEAAGEYSDATEQILKTRYDHGVALRASGEWESAVTEFEAAGEYSDATEQILKTRYDHAIALRASGEWEQAVTEFEAAGEYSDAAEQILETEYQHAKQLYSDGDYLTAYYTYQSILGYADVDSILQQDNNLFAAAVAAAREARIKPYKTAGSIVPFGTYEQDNNSANGAETVEWIVLDVQGEKSLLLSRYGLDAKPYNTARTDITWEKSSLRAWLNSSFINTAFNEEEQAAILNTFVDNSKGQGYSGYSTNGGNNTQDRIFLLSYHEAFDLYFLSDESRKCVPTDYAIAQGALISNKQKADGRATGWWWLRSPGFDQYVAASVDSDGSRINCNVSHVDVCVRPAFWVNLESDIF